MLSVNRILAELPAFAASTTIVLGIFALLAGLLAWYIVSYYLDPLELRKFAGPKLAAFSAAWSMNYCRKNKRFWGIHKAHEKYGPIVRIQPDHVSFNVGEAINDIYGHGKDLMKAPFYDTLAASHRSMFDTTDRVEHGLKRKYVSHMFAPRSVTELEDIIDQTTQNLCNVLDRYAKNQELMNMRHWISMYAFDIIGQMGFAADLGCLTRGDDIIQGQTRDGKKYTASAIKGVYDGGSYNVFWGQAPAYLKYTKWLTQWTTGRFYADFFFDVAIDLVKTRVPQEDAAEYERTRRYDLFHRMVVNKNGDALGLEFEEMFSEAAVLMIAGSDTSGTGVCNTILELIQDPVRLAKLREELDAAIPKGTVIPTEDQVKALPYLAACINEALRLRPPNAQGLPRIVSEKGALVCGYHLKPGTVVSVPTYTIHRNEKYFKDALKFNPERWINNPDPQEAYNLQKYVIPFSHGSRACVGRNLANLELRVTVAAVLLRYDFELRDPGKPIEILERFNSNPADFYVKIRPRVRDYN
jgi:benzoate 4-monooxygenase